MTLLEKIAEINKISAKYELHDPMRKKKIEKEYMLPREFDARESTNLTDLLDHVTVTAKYAKCFPALVGLVEAYLAGHALSSDLTFSQLSESQIFSAVLTPEENIEAALKCLERGTFKSNRKKQKYIKVAKQLLEECIPQLESNNKAADLRADIQLSSFKAYVNENANKLKKFERK